MTLPLLPTMFLQLLHMMLHLPIPRPLHMMLLPMPQHPHTTPLHTQQPQRIPTVRIIHTMATVRTILPMDTTTHTRTTIRTDILRQATTLLQTTTTL